jgi:hypothetical protein
LEAWDRTRNLARRIIGIKSASAARLELIVERFGKRAGRLFLLDLARRTGAEMGSRSGRLVFRERFRLFSTPAISGVEARGIKRRSQLGIQPFPGFSACLSAPWPAWMGGHRLPAAGECGRDSLVGLIWLSYLRERERRVTLEGLAIYVPAGHEQTRRYGSSVWILLPPVLSCLPIRRKISSSAPTRAITAISTHV